MEDWDTYRDKVNTAFRSHKQMLDDFRIEADKEAQKRCEDLLLTILLSLVGLVWILICRIFSTSFFFSRALTCDMILAQITQQEQKKQYNGQSPLGNGDTLKRKGVFRKFSTLLRNRRHTDSQTIHENETTSSHISIASKSKSKYQNTM